MRVRRCFAAAVVAATLLPIAPGLTFEPVDCSAAPAADFRMRDNQNLFCSQQRYEDQLGNPAFAAKGAAVAPGLYAEGLAWQAANPGTPSFTAARLFPGLRAADPYRLKSEWAASGRGRVFPAEFTSTYSLTRQEGDLFLPPAPPGPDGPYPGVILTTGGTQAFREAYYWAAEGLAEAGYMVLAYDVPTQGGSQTWRYDENGLPVSPPRCFHGPLLDTQCSEMFEASVEDALDYFLSTSNPVRAKLDGSRIGLAGHSLGAVYSTLVGQVDQRVDAIVSWDSTGFLPASIRLQAHAPTLTIASDYPGTDGPRPQNSTPNPFNHSQGYQQLTCTGGVVCSSGWALVDGMQVALRAGTHYEWAYLPYAPPPRTATRHGERVSFHYLLAWFDAYLKASSSAFTRLTGRSFDSSSDASSIGAGTYAPPAGNLPLTLSGGNITGRLSFYYRSSYRLRIGTPGELRCDDLRLNYKFEGSPLAQCDQP